MPTDSRSAFDLDRPARHAPAPYSAALVALLLGACTTIDRPLGVLPADGRVGALDAAADDAPADDADAPRAADAPSGDEGVPAAITPTAAVRACALMADCTFQGAAALSLCTFMLTHYGFTPASYARFVADGASLDVLPVPMAVAPGHAMPSSDEQPPRGVFPINYLEPGQRDCMLRASRCDELLRCFNHGEPSAACTPGGIRCDGTILRACAYANQFGYLRGLTDQPRQFAFDCAAQGQGCYVGGPSRSGDTWTGCSLGACDETTFRPSCSGVVADRCILGHHRQLSCPSGTECRVETVAGVLDARCVRTSAECDPAATPGQCDGNTAVACATSLDDPRGHIERTACPADETCRADGNLAFCYDSSGCAQFPGAAQCNTATGALEVCALSRETLDCRALGYTGCGFAPSRGDTWCN